MPLEREPLIATRHSTLERLSHYANIVSLAVLVFSGFSVYFGLNFLDYGDAYAVHIIAAAVFLSVNWIVLPYSAFVNGTLPSYVFWVADARRLWMALKNFFTGSEYPQYTVYDIGKHKFINRLHPVAKLLLYAHYLALFILTITGLVLYSGSMMLLGVDISGLIVHVMDFVSPYFSLSGIALVRILHVATAYWFVAEVIIHVGMVQLDPKKFQHIKSIFLDGKEDLAEDQTADIVDTSEN